MVHHVIACVHVFDLQEFDWRTSIMSFEIIDQSKSIFFFLPKSIPFYNMSEFLITWFCWRKYIIYTCIYSFLQINYFKIGVEFLFCGCLKKYSVEPELVVFPELSKNCTSFDMSQYIFVICTKMIHFRILLIF